MNIADLVHKRPEQRRVRRYIKGTPQERFAAYLEPGETKPGMDTPCIEWAGNRNAKGYGLFSIPGEDGRHHTTLAHRFALQQAIGHDPRPVLHQCDNAGCCNPAHLRYGTREENNLEMVQRNRVARGEQKSQARLTESVVTEARDRVRKGEHITSVAADLGFYEDTIRHAVRGATWPHLPGAVPSRYRSRSK